MEQIRSDMSLRSVNILEAPGKDDTVKLEEESNEEDNVMEEITGRIYQLTRELTGKDGIIGTKCCPWSSVAQYQCHNCPQK